MSLTNSEIKTMYQVIDRQTKKVMGTYKTRKAAKRAVDRLDNEYGAYRYYHQTIA
jgi:hypothetical protein